MPVYVDSLKTYPTSAIQPSARRVSRRWCHMWADAGEEEALHAMAQRIGLKRAWFQQHERLPHYDLTPSRRAEAIEAGAVEMDVRIWFRQQKGVMQ